MPIDWSAACGICTTDTATGLPKEARKGVQQRVQCARCPPSHMRHFTLLTDGTQAHLTILAHLCHMTPHSAAVCEEGGGAERPAPAPLNTPPVTHQAAQ
jgi:hypothetical protein